MEQIERLLPEGTQETEQLKKAYQLVLRLRSQLIGVIYDMEMCAPNAQTSVCDDTDKQSVTLLIDEPLPRMKELTSSVQEHWITLIHDAIARESQTGIPKFQKAMVTIEVTTPRGTNNAKVWDTSNRAINLIINNLKGIFFRDDDFEHMAFSVVAKWGDIGRTTIRICELSQEGNYSFLSKNDEIL